MIRVLDARFVVTAVAPEGYPRPDFPEIAFIGRSNVGKSSMINALAGRRKLVRVSNTPGRTRTLNFFDVDLDEAGRRRTVRLVDLPGYGYAQASKTDRGQWHAMTDTYLHRRAVLGVVVAIIDSEVGPSPEDLQMIDRLSEVAGRVMVVATKIDRIPKAKRSPRLTVLASQLELPLGAVVPFSATEKEGVDEAWEALLANLPKSGLTAQEDPTP